MKAILTAACAAVLFASSLPAFAAQPELETRSATINYSDLNLTNAHGASTLEQRVSGAIRQVCDGPAFELRDKLQQRACQRTAGTAASNDVQKAITTAKQQFSTKTAGPASLGAVSKTISSSSQSVSTSHRQIPQR